MSRTKQFLLGFVVAAALVITVVAVMLARQPAPPPFTTPQPNGYDDLVNAAELIPDGAGRRLEQFHQLDREQLAALLQAQDQVLALVESGFKKQCRIPDYAVTNSASRRLISLRTLARYLTARGRAAELGGQTNEAAVAYAQPVELAQKTVAGGVLIDHLVAVAVQAQGTKELSRIAQLLDAKTCRQLSGKLEDVDRAMQPFEQTVALEQYWLKRQYGLRGRLAGLLNRQLNSAPQKAKGSILAADHERRRLVLLLAARAYELENGRRPTTASDLVPRILKSIPINPATGEPYAIE